MTKAVVTIRFRLLEIVAEPVSVKGSATKKIETKLDSGFKLPTYPEILCTNDAIGVPQKYILYNSCKSNIKAMV